MKTNTAHRESLQRGAAMLMVLAFTIMGGIAVTAWIYLIAARVGQADRMADNVSRHLMWGNNAAINQQYSLGYTFRDTISEAQVTGLVTNAGATIVYGGQIENEIDNLQAFNSVNNYTSPASYAYPFDNIRKVLTSDNSVYYTQTTSSVDGSQNEHLLYYNFQKTYPRTLMGDLLIVHTPPSGAGTNYITDNLYVNGRALIYDSAASISTVAADECLNLTKTGTNTTLNNVVAVAGSGTAATLLPQNYPSKPIFTAGYSSAGTGAVLDGSLNMINNSNFLPGSLSAIMQTGGTSGWVECTNNTTIFPTAGSTTYVAATGTTPAYVRTGYNSATVSYYPSGATSSNCTIAAQRVTACNNSVDTTSSTRPSYYPILSSGSSSGYTTNSTYGYRTNAVSSTYPLYTLNLRLKTLGQHVHITGGVDQLVLEGATTSGDYTSPTVTTPIIIWLDQDSCRDVRFVGESKRPIIFATGTGSSGATLYTSWQSTTDLGTTYTPSTARDWRIHFINEYRNIWLNAPGTTGASAYVKIVGGIRTNWQINCTDTATSPVVSRFILTRETSPGTLATLLPRDAWFEPLLVQ